MSTVSGKAAQQSSLQGSALKRSAIWQPTQPVFWLFLVLLVVSAVYTCFELVMSASGLPAAGAAVLLVSAQTTLLVLIVRAMPRFKRQPASLRLTALLWGIFIVPAVAILANTSASEAIGVLGLGTFDASLSAPINEDLIRLMGVLLVLSLVRAKRLTVMDGAIYGFIVGAGFEVVENLLYALRSEDFMATISVGVTRLLVGFGLHALWTTLAGAGLAYCLSRRQSGQPARWWVLVPAVGVPMLLHAGWDSPEFSIISALKLPLLVVLYLLSVAAFLFAVRWGRRSEFCWFATTRGSTLNYEEFKRLPKAERRGIAAAAVAEELVEPIGLESNAAGVGEDQSQKVEAGDPRS